MALTTSTITGRVPLPDDANPAAAEIVFTLSGYDTEGSQVIPGGAKARFVLVNGDMGPAEVQMFCQLDETGKNLMRAAVQQMNLSARAYHRVLKLARTIADLADASTIAVPHLAEALQYRPKESI